MLPNTAIDIKPIFGNGCAMVSPFLYLIPTADAHELPLEVLCIVEPYIGKTLSALAIIKFCDHTSKHKELILANLAAGVSRSAKTGVKTLIWLRLWPLPVLQVQYYNFIRPTLVFTSVEIAEFVVHIDDCPVFDCRGSPFVTFVHLLSVHLKFDYSFSELLQVSFFLAFFVAHKLLEFHPFPLLVYYSLLGCHFYFLNVEIDWVEML